MSVRAQDSPAAELVLELSVFLFETAETDHQYRRTWQRGLRGQTRKKENPEKDPALP